MSQAGATAGAARRRRQLLQFGASTVALLVAAAFAFNARDVAADAVADRDAQRARLLQVSQQHAAAEHAAAESTRAAQLLAQVAASGWTPGDWGERRINLQQTRLPREAVEELLQTTARGPGRIFGAEAFDLSVTRMEDGLFEVPDAQAQPLQLTLRGAHFFRTRD